MTSLKFEKCGADPRTGEPLYRLVIGGRTVREDLTLDQVVEAINRRDEELLGWDHAPRDVDDDGSLRSAFGLGRDDRDEGGADPGESPTRLTAGAPFYPAGHRRQGGQRGE